MAVNDILRAAPSDVGAKLVEELQGSFARRRWSMVITDDDFFAAEVLANYQRGPDAVGEGDALYPVTGMRVRPGSVLTPK
jgi:hypothetical protein